MYHYVCGVWKTIRANHDDGLAIYKVIITSLLTMHAFKFSLGSDIQHEMYAKISLPHKGFYLHLLWPVWLCTRV